MRDLFSVTSASGIHPVRIAEAGLCEAVAAVEPSIVIADALFRKPLAECDRPCLFIDAIEKSKELGRLPDLIEACRRAGLTRDGHIAAVGGGIVQDVGCFVASTYMRGVKWTFLPTTLLAMVDSCIGGKSSVNVGAYKNLIGTFHPSAAVVIVPGTTATLPAEHIAAGRAEAAKICFAHGAETFDRYLELDGGEFNDDPSALIALSLSAKKWFIEMDEFDHAERLLLNFGHSFAHALESCSAYAVPHGVAVGVGCLAATALSCRLHPSLEWSDRVQRLRRQMLSILKPLGQLPASLVSVNSDSFLHFWNADKKHNVELYRPILINQFGSLERWNLPKSATCEAIVWEGFEEARSAIVPNE